MIFIYTFRYAVYNIVIDHKRTPNVASEFENIDYQTDKDGNIRPKLEDKDNHSMGKVA